MSDEEIVKYSGISLTSKPSNDTLKKFVYSIDEIEEKTGLDFFCNLIDSVEDELEAKSADECISAWAW